jgi:hypothetical protein
LQENGAARRRALSLAPAAGDNRRMTPEQRRRWRASRLVFEFATRGIDPPTLENARDFLDLLDPSGEEDEIAVEVADWMDQLYAEAETREYATRALIERARRR